MWGNAAWIGWRRQVVRLLCTRIALIHCGVEVVGSCLAYNKKLLENLWRESSSCKSYPVSLNVCEVELLAGNLDCCAEWKK